jgi:hypothetical protein
MSNLREWFSVLFDDTAIVLQANPPGATAWQATIAWEHIIRVCFEAGDWSESDTIYIFTYERPESYVVPIEADGGQALWSEILRRNLFDAEMAIAAATATNKLFCFPDPQAEAVPATLTAPAQLPDLEDEKLFLTWDQIEADSIIRRGNRVIWQERTGWEVYERFEEIAGILKQKYGKRLVDIVPTPGSLYALYGGSTRASFHVASVRESLGRDSKQNMPAGSHTRLNEISYLLTTALDSEEEYVYHGEMSDYMRSYAVDAARDLCFLFRSSPPIATELEYCVEALSDPERIKRGRSKEVLVTLRETARPILEALAHSPDPHLRIFALETGRTSLNPYFPDPLYGNIGLNRQLLEDPDENVRAAALSTVQETMVHNARYLENSIQRGDSNPLLEFMSEAVALLGDPSPRVRAEAANVLARWAAKVDGEVVESFLGREGSPAAREIVAKAKARGDSTPEDDQPALNGPYEEG